MEMPIPEIKNHEVLIQVKATSICGTDVHIYNWDDWAKGRVKAPYILDMNLQGKLLKWEASLTSKGRGLCIG